MNQIECNIGEKIRDRRLALGISGRTLAQRAGVSVSVVTQAERGIHTPRLENLQKIAEALDIELTELLI